MKTKFGTLIIMMLSLGIWSCEDDETPEEIPPYAVNFSSTELGVQESQNIEIVFSRSAEAAGSIVLEIGNTNLTYGEDADFFTRPALNANQIVLPYVTGANSVNAVVLAGSSLNIEADEVITFSLVDNSEFFELGTNASISLTFGENFVAGEGAFAIDGGGADFPNQVFLDLSKRDQQVVDKLSWDLGFSSSADDFVVTLNSAAHVMARPLDETDIDAVVADDTLGFASKMYISNYFDTEASLWIDHQSGDHARAAIGYISSNNEENPVYIVKRDGDGRNWKKIRILRAGDDYTIQIADISATTHSTHTVSKDDLYNYIHFDLSGVEIEVEPAKDKWDLMYGTYSGVANFGVDLAIGYNDYIIINREKVGVYEVEEETIAYDDFVLEDYNVRSLVNDDIATIGSSWRSLVDFSLVLDESIYHVLRDGEHNVYKLKFTSLTSPTEREAIPNSNSNCYDDLLENRSGYPEDFLGVSIRLWRRTEVCD